MLNILFLICRRIVAEYEKTIAQMIGEFNMECFISLHSPVIVYFAH